MTNFQILLLVISFSAPLIAVIGSIWINYWLTNKKDKNQVKQNVFNTLMENRFDVGSTGFIKAVNLIPIVFKDYPKIIQLNKELYNAIQSNLPAEKKNDAMISLLLGIARELGYSKNLEASDIKKVINVQK